jgi:hypothetical protein
VILGLLIACVPSEPPQTCLAVTTHDDAGQVRLEDKDHALVVALETGANDLKVFQHGAPWMQPHWSSQTKVYNLWGGKERVLERLAQVRFGSWTNATVLNPWREDHEPVHEIESAWGGLVDAWGGAGFLLSLGDQAQFSPGQVCGVQRGQCSTVKGGKPIVELQTSDGETLRFMVDTAMIHSRIFRHGDQAVLLTEETSGAQLRAYPFRENRKAHYGSGELGEGPIDGVVGWLDVAQSTWSWDLCSGQVSITQAQALQPEQPGAMRQAQRDNGHAVK